MKVKRLAIIPNDETIEQGPRMAAALTGTGCEAPNCNCSPPFWLSISDGEVSLSVELTETEVERLRHPDEVVMEFKGEAVSA